MRTSKSFRIPALVIASLAFVCLLAIAAAPRISIADDDAPAATTEVLDVEAPTTQTEPTSQEEDATSSDAQPTDELPQNADEQEPVNSPVEIPSVSVQTHMQNRGWLGTVSDGGVAGIAGGGLRMEALRLSLTGGVSGIEYRAHVQGYGWQGWVKDGALAGTTGRSLRIEALQIRLSDELAESYDIYYTTYVEGVGWMQWAKNGEKSGSAGLNCRLEALRVVIVEKGSAAPEAMDGAYSISYLPSIGLTYRTHVQNVGWLGYASLGSTSGTTGRSLRLEGLKVHSSASEISGTVRYQAHVQNIGWQDWRESDGLAGTTGRSLRIEAVKLELTDEMASYYDIYYRVHLQFLGWTAWASNGAACGSTGMQLRCEAIQIRLVPKGLAAPSNSGAGIDKPLITAPDLRYDTNPQNAGWQGERTAGQTAGTTGQSKALYGLKLSLGATDTSIPGGITYRAHCSNVGWRGWSSDGSDAGAGARIECVQIKLTGKAASVYDVYYRVHSAGFGWLGWAKNGASAGTTGLSRGVEAIQVRLVTKGGAAPGSTARPYIDKSYYYDAATRKAQSISSSTGWLILVNLSEHRIYVFSGSRNNWTKRQTFVCSSGAARTPTVTGTFKVGSRGYSFGSGYTCYYWTQFYGDYLFHSILYNQGTFTVQDGRLGMNISHGCVRMPIDQAKWIYQNIPTGTTVVVYY